MYSVYKLTCPENKVYIGVTKQKLTKRWNGGYGYITQTKLFQAIRKYGWSNFKKELLCICLTKEEAKQKEIEYTKELKSYVDEYGYNSYVGSICMGHKRKSKTKDLCKIKTSKVSETTRERMKANHKGGTPKRPIIQYDLYMNKLNEYISLKEAERTLSIDHSSIAKCCRNKIETAGGFIWRYKEGEKNA